MTDDPARGCPVSIDGDEPDAPREGELSYNSYLMVDELLSLQRPQSEPEHHDEMLFIVIHQTYELWFKLILHELENAITYMQQRRVLRARHFVHRVVEIMKVLVAQIHVLETLEPAEFLEFRFRLMPASGFQSSQFREVEYLCGLKDPRYLAFFRNRPEMLGGLEARLQGPDLRSTYYSMVRELGFAIPQDITWETLNASDEAREELLQVLRPLYEDTEAHLPLNLLTESLLSLDQALALWREHHVRVVERIIGRKRGTGGSSGVEYLQTTTSKRCFPCLWELRTVLERGT